MHKQQPDIGLIESFLGWTATFTGGGTSYRRMRSGNHSYVYELTGADKTWYLKIGSGLEKEKLHLDWLKGKVPVSTVTGYIMLGEQEALLKTSVEGVDLAELAKIWPAEKIVEKLSSALKQFHAIDAGNWPYRITELSSSTLVHGDACLPNLIFDEDGTFKGYIDVIDTHLGSVEEDLSAAVWSLQFNLGPGHGLSFLREYGIKGADDAMVERLRSAYETDILHSQLPNWK